MRSQTLPNLLATPYVFHRLEPVTERLATEQLPAVLDADLKTWYLNRTATILAPHLLEFYRRQVEKALTTQGLAALAPPARSLLQVSTTDTGTLVQLTLHPTVIDTVSAALVHELAASDEARGGAPPTLPLGRLRSSPKNAANERSPPCQTLCLRQLSCIRPAHRTAERSVT